MPFHCTTELVANPAPKTSIVLAAPTVRLVGEMLWIVGVTGAVTIARLAVFECPPPGVGLVTTTLSVPSFAWSATVAANVSVVPLTYVVVRGVPFTNTVEAAIKPVPVTVTVDGDGEPTFRTDGESEIALTGGFTIVTEDTDDTPPPGVAFTAASERLPATEKSVPGSATLTSVGLINVVARAEPFTLITVDGTNPVPLTVITADAVPVSSVVVDKDAIVGAGLSTSRLTAVALLLPPPFQTTTGSCAPFVNCEAGTVAVSCVALT